MKNHIFTTILFFSLTLTNASGQSSPDCITIQEPIFVRVEQAASFTGSLQEFFENDLKALIPNLNGTVQLQILIDPDGKVRCSNINRNSTTLQSIRLKEAVGRMPAWTPAKQNNRPVNFSVILQITFSASKLSLQYLNEKQSVVRPVINTNTSNNPDIIKDRKTKSTWKLWNFSNSVIPANLSRNVAIDANSVIWYCTDNGIVKIDGDKPWQVFNGINIPALADKQGRTWTTGLAIDKANHIWIQSFDVVLKYDGERWIKFDTSNSPLRLVRKICTDKNNIIWFCTFKGLVKYDGKTWNTYNTVNSKIASDNVKDIYTDKNETLWIATEKGINKVANGTWTLLNNENTNIPENDVTSIEGDAAGNIWAGLGTRNKNHLIKIDTANSISVFPSGAIWNITIDNSTNLVWLATNGKGLVSFNGKEFIQYDKTNSPMPSNTVSDIVIDKDGNKWVSTFSGLVFLATKK